MHTLLGNGGSNTWVAEKRHHLWILPGFGTLRVLVQGSADSARFFGRLTADGYEPFVLGLHSSRVQPKL